MNNFFLFLWFGINTFKKLFYLCINKKPSTWIWQELSGKIKAYCSFLLLRIVSNWGRPVAQWLSTHVPLQQPSVYWFGSWVWTWHRLASHAVVGVPHIMSRKIGTDVSLGPVFLSKKRRIGSS